MSAATCPVCTKAHRGESKASRACAALLAGVGTVVEARATRNTVEITAPDVMTVLSSKLGALVACPWGGVMAVALPYAGQDVVVTHADVVAWWRRCGQSVSRTAAALSADLAWLAQDDLAVAA